jgi:hypothetical protein
MKGSPIKLNSIEKGADKTKCKIKNEKIEYPLYENIKLFDIISIDENDEIRSGKDDDFQVIIEGENINKIKIQKLIKIQNNNDGTYEVYIEKFEIETDIEIYVYVDGELISNCPIKSKTIKQKDEDEVLLKIYNNKDVNELKQINERGIINRDEFRKYSVMIKNEIEEEEKNEKLMKEKYELIKEEEEEKEEEKKEEEEVVEKDKINFDIKKLKNRDFYYDKEKLLKLGITLKDENDEETQTPRINDENDEEKEEIKENDKKIEKLIRRATIMLKIEEKETKEQVKVGKSKEGEYKIGNELLKVYILKCIKK